MTTRQIDTITVFTKCASCHLFVEPNHGADPDEARWVHLRAGTTPTRRSRAHTTPSRAQSPTRSTGGAPTDPQPCAPDSPTPEYRPPPKETTMTTRQIGTSTDIGINSHTGDAAGGDHPPTRRACRRARHRRHRGGLPRRHRRSAASWGVAQWRNLVQQPRGRP